MRDRTKKGRRALCDFRSLFGSNGAWLCLLIPPTLAEGGEAIVTIALELLGLHLAVWTLVARTSYSIRTCIFHFALLVCRLVSCIGSRMLRTFDEGAESEA